MPNREKGTLSKLIHLLLSPYRVFRMLCFSLGLAVLVGMLGSGIYVATFIRSLPNVSRLSFDELKHLARNRISNVREDKSRTHRWTDIADINRNFLYAVVMSEDSTFFEHDGIDVDALLNSLATNIKHRKYEYGGSTISQQVTKNLFLTRNKALIRKIKELILTERLEKYFSKNQILELYLNVAEFGPDLYGVREAAEHYFGKTPQEINAAEGAFIALMLPSPRKHHFAIFQNRNLSASRKKKIRRILGDMLANELISPQQYHEYAHYDFERALAGTALRSLAGK